MHARALIDRVQVLHRRLT